MLETFLKLFLEQLHPFVAIPLAIVIAALVMSIYGKTKSFFDAVLTIDNAMRSTPYLVGSVIVIHATVGMAAAYWGYFHTDLFSPPVSQTLNHPLGRSYFRFSDWSLIFVEALLYLPLLLALSHDTPNSRRATIAFVLAIIPTAIFVALMASTYPALLAPHPNPLTLNSATGFLWWYAEVVLLAFPIGLALTALWLITSHIRSRP